ncbi:adenosine kinase [Candidatus Dependentiae bacterium]|nr:adenosine kinase [Candidatus Dependentiae bacterium]
MTKILGIGNSLVDMMIRIPDETYLSKFNLPKGSMNLVDINTSNMILNETGKFISQKAAGGSAANTVCGLAQLGVKTAFIGKIGKDETGNFFKSDLQSNSVEEKLFYSNSSESGRVAALITPDSERTFATYLGASIELCAEDLKIDLFKWYDICYIEGYLVQNHKLIETACKLAADAGCEVCIDLASYNVVNDNKKFLEGIIDKYINIIFANEEESKSITGASPEQALNILGEMVDIAVVKIGKNGSMVKKGNDIFKAGIRAANAIDTTGAGDLFASGFLYGYINNYPFDKCAELGAITSGYVVEVLGAKMNGEIWGKIKSDIQKIKF